MKALVAVLLSLGLVTISFAGVVPIQNIQLHGQDKASFSFSWQGNDTLRGQGRFVVHACRAGHCGQAGGLLVYTGQANSGFSITSYYQNGVRLSPGQWQLRVNWTNGNGGTLTYKDGPVFTVK